MDNFYKQLTVVGYATLNVYVESGTERQPTIDKPGLQVTQSLICVGQSAMALRFILSFFLEYHKITA